MWGFGGARVPLLHGDAESQSRQECRSHGSRGKDAWAAIERRAEVTGNFRPYGRPESLGAVNVGAKVRKHIRPCLVGAAVPLLQLLQQSLQ